jgi:hypothetical protein
LNKDPNTLVSDAVGYYRKGNLPQAELYCRQVLQDFGEHPDALALLGMISLNINANDLAVAYLQRALARNPGHQAARHYLEHAQKQPLHEPSGDQRFLLIKAWGYGFWADVDHVIGQLLLAGMTDRIPVVHWGENSLFRARDSSEAFTQFFEPVSHYEAEALTEKAYSFYPPKWSSTNLFENDVSKWSGQYSRVAGIHLLNRDENVLVSDFHTSVRDLIPWLKTSHPLHGQAIEQIYRYLFDQYIRLKPHLQDAIDRFWSENLQGRGALAVHVRGSDKEVEVPDLQALNRTYRENIEAHLKHHPDALVFLLTDSSTVLEEYQRRYGDKVITTRCRRTVSKTGLHYQALDHPEALANEVIIDTCLAARCSAFIGNGFSNVSQTVLHLKPWEADQCFLCGHNMSYEPNFYLHEW